MSNGVGANARVELNFESAGYKDFYQKTGNGLSMVQFDSCTVFHELVQTYHILIGELVTVQHSSLNLCNPLRSFQFIEEARTTGLGNFRDEELSENKYRADDKSSPNKKRQLNTKLIRPYKWKPL